MRLIVIFVAVVLGLTGCVDPDKLKTFTEMYTGSDKPLNPAGGFFVMLAPHGAYGSKVYEKSGRQTTQAVAAALSVHAEKVEVAEQISSLESALAQTISLNLKYLLQPQILHWEDRATQWSNKPDRISLRFSIYDAASGTRLVTYTIEASSKFAVLFGNYPEELLAKPSKKFVARLF